ncbi:MAG: SIS domain-containing protein [Elusimicrobia bacterium]|nr:SIS domain-containing protein [Elusimicrobiota bacterium]
MIGLRCAKDRADLGAAASKLLRMLEYRGYDSTGAILQSEDGRIVLRKDVGSPTVVTKRLAIAELSGRVFCGQVRWATFGGVTRENAQPHEMRCKTHFYGAHNGNITNCHQLKQWLLREGHAVVSDNDGEMLVHTVEHFFAIELAKTKDRAAALRSAVLSASKKLVGSYAAVVVDPVTQRLAAIKAGSSLYMGVGDGPDGAFTIASSDLASVLSMTKLIVPLSEDEFVLYDHAQRRCWNLRSGAEIRKKPLRSRLRVEETELKEPFKYFMQQEIFSQPDAVRRVIGLFLGSSPLLSVAQKALKAHPGPAKRARDAAAELASLTHAAQLQRRASRFYASAAFAQLKAAAAAHEPELARGGFESSMGSFLEELARLAPKGCAPALRLLDGLFLAEEAEDVGRRADRLVDALLAARRKGGAITLVACGTSYHAAKVASVFFNKIAGIKVWATLPGDFRAESAASVRDGDLLIAISQSGETKDLIDVVNLVRASGRKATVAAIVNNVNSTLALEKADLYLPLFCGPEIAVPATKSFMNQLAVLYILALKAAERDASRRDRRRRLDNFLRVPELLEETFACTRDSLDQAAADLFLEPSIHILATGMQGVAKEGALKVREVVLNHTEGYEGAEFKHGPNTILGVNTVFGMEAVRSILEKFAAFSEEAAGKGALSARGLARLYRAVAGYAFDDVKPSALDEAELRAFRQTFAKHDFFESLYTNYPLVFVTGPSERDVNITISQINTHKIRGADIYVIAEESKALRDAARPCPPARSAARPRSGYIRLPRLELLDRLEIEDHGVHPDSPKNVSKSITVD